MDGCRWMDVYGQMLVDRKGWTNKTKWANVECMDIGGWTSMDRRWRTKGTEQIELNSKNQMGKHRTDVDYDIKWTLNKSWIEVDWKSNGWTLVDGHLWTDVGRWKGLDEQNQMVGTKWADIGWMLTMTSNRCWTEVEWKLNRSRMKVKRTSTTTASNVANGNMTDTLLRTQHYKSLESFTTMACIRIFFFLLV
jgi:hypothetical protein